MLTTMLDYLRIALYGAIMVILFAFYQAWEKERTVITPTAKTVSENQGYIPNIVQSDQISQPTTISSSTLPVATQHVIRVTTDLLEVEIDALGGNIVQTKLLKYPEQLHEKNAYTLLNDLPETRYIAQSGLLSLIGPDTKQGQALYTSDQVDYKLSDTQDALQVTLYWKNKNGIAIDKVFTFKRNSYEIDVTYLIANQSIEPWNGNLYLQLMRKNAPPANHQGFISFATYFGAAISSPEKHFQKITFKDMSNQAVNQSILGGWAAMIQHYFVSAWVPEKNITSHYFSNITSDGLYTIGMINPKIDVLPGQKAETTAKLYVGPAIADELEKTAPGLKLTIDYGWFWFISAILFWMMQQIYNVIGNWGWSIVIVTLVIKLMFYHLSAKSYRSMSGLKLLQPKISLLKERYADDKQKFTQATLELYKKEKVNPMSGCLPILIQIPVFIGLYRVLIESVQLRQAPFIFWIQDLSIKDPFYVLPVLMGLSMFLQQRLNPPAADPLQAKVMMFMPIVFTVLFINFPAGLMLYWFVNNTLSFLQQWYIMHTIEKSKKKEKVSHRKEA